MGKGSPNETRSKGYLPNNINNTYNNNNNNNKLTVWVVDGVSGLSGELVLSSVDKESEQEAEPVWEARVNVQEVPPTSERALVLTVSK